ncbi:RluA family pseudouridine synthase [Candidatus Bandiella euplotis]|uniref:Ribosomal large subunit pseudouridine synthase C n=1 Tax=Candidatus Bandiella euplotis TaxID=1664265 RepID=A0ABZ0UM24_9RICK|nr:RluA family pseudouridine synthase [Candidatus Bandiella woodruffii]WPX97208.1 RluA family pseudouridine synthase [Candidatus Bandiella woodruffii]
MEIRTLQVEKNDDGLRLDRWFYRNLPSMPFVVVAKLIRKGQVRIDGKRAKINSYVKSEQIIRTPVIEFEEHKRQPDVKPNNFNSTKAAILKSVIFEDENLMVLNKQYGLCVQDGTNVSISIDRILRLAGIEAKIVHRIDKKTTGLLILAKSSYAAAEISKLFRDKDINKTYLAILCGVPEERKGVIQTVIPKFESDSSKEQAAETKFRVLVTYQDMLSLVEMTPLTGRKHQIRLHSKEINCPILGDSKNKYRGSGNKNSVYKNAKLHLHAYSLSFKLFDKTYNLKAKLPDHFLDTMTKYFPTAKIKGYDF